MYTELEERATSELAEARRATSQAEHEVQSLRARLREAEEAADRLKAEVQRQGELLSEASAGKQAAVAAGDTAAAAAAVARSQVQDLRSRLAKREKELRDLHKQELSAARLETELQATKKLLAEQQKRIRELNAFNSRLLGAGPRKGTGRAPAGGGVAQQGRSASAMGGAAPAAARGSRLPAQKGPSPPGPGIGQTNQSGLILTEEDRRLLLDVLSEEDVSAILG